MFGEKFVVGCGGGRHDESGPSGLAGTPPVKGCAWIKVKASCYNSSLFLFHNTTDLAATCFVPTCMC